MRSNFPAPRILLIVLAILSLAATASAQARLGGTVVDDAGKPIKAATVTAESLNLGQSFSASTDESGKFNMIGLRPGQWRLIASAPGYLPEAGEVTLKSGNNANAPVTIAIRRTGAVVGALGGISARDLQTQLAAAETLFNEKRWDDAVRAYRAILAKAPSLTSINLQVAAAFQNKGDQAAALAVYQDMLRVEPANEKARIGAGRVSAVMGDTAGAEAAFTQAAESPSAGREAFMALGDWKSERGQTADAARWYQKAVVADPSWGKPLYKLGLNAMKQGDTAAASDFMTKAIAVDPISAEAGLARAAIAQLNK